jgi:hypothetical protein
MRWQEPTRRRVWLVLGGGAVVFAVAGGLVLGPAVKAAYRADKDGFLIAWRTETNDELPNWLTS